MSCSTSPPWPVPANFLAPKTPTGVVLLSFPLTISAEDLYSVTISARPTDDLQFTGLTVVDDQVQAVTSGGIAGLVYALDLTVKTIHTLSNTTTWLLPVSSMVLPAVPCSPESTMYGSSQATWRAQPPVIDVATALIGTGSTQLTAAYLPAYNNVVLSAPLGTGFILNSAAVNSPVAILNLDPVNNPLIYPPVGARINNLAVNVPIAISENGGRLTFTTSSPFTQWYAG